MIQAYMFSVVRHVMTGIAGALIGFGVMSAQSQDAFVAANSEVVVGLALYAIGQGASLLGKKKEEKK